MFSFLLTFVESSHENCRFEDLKLVISTHSSILLWPFQTFNTPLDYTIQRDAQPENCVYRRLFSIMPSAAVPRKSLKVSKSPNRRLADVVIVALAVLLFAVQNIDGQQNGPQQTCPPANEISPCVCTVKKNGLDILCEATDYTHISRAMTTLKPKSPIIFYLKLRHNSLPKLQGFIFLALDIKHLTIHNSSLAVIEETSLSSLGEARFEVNFVAIVVCDGWSEPFFRVLTRCVIIHYVA